LAIVRLRTSSGSFQTQIAGSVVEAEPLVQADDVAGEVDRVAAEVGPVLRHVHAVDRRDPAGQEQPVRLADDELVVLEELLVGAALDRSRSLLL
jgi:hypothetical protein